MKTRPAVVAEHHRLRAARKRIFNRQDRLRGYPNPISHYAGPILVAKKQGGTQTWYHSDRLGSIRLMTNAAGVEVKDYDYQAFGNTQSQTGTEYNERGFNGHISDAETGLIYMGARYCEAPRSVAEWATTRSWAASSPRIRSLPVWRIRRV